MPTLTPSIYNLSDHPFVMNLTIYLQSAEHLARPDKGFRLPGDLHGNSVPSICGFTRFLGIAAK
jgi:hypothetical protein